MARRNITNRNRTNRNNPYNPEHTLFKRLTKLFSGPIINYRHQQVRKHKRHKLDKYARTFRSATGQQFKKQSYNPYDNLIANIMVNQNRAERYADFDQMEYTPELASALDIYADEITTHSEFGKVLVIECPNEEIRGILDTLFYKALNIEFNLYGWARSMCKFGDHFLYLDLDDELGVKGVIGLPSAEVERLEGEDPTNPSYVQYQWNSAGMTLENWQIAHFRILGNDKYAPYGTSVFDPARRVWRQLVLMEDAMMAYRIVRAPDRRVFYIDVGGIPPEDVEQYMQKVMTQMKRHQVVDPDNGKIDLRYNPASIEEDFYIPVRGGQGSTKIENIAGQQRANDIDDVKYLRDKLFSAIKIPMSYLSRGEGADEDKATLSQKDIRFARTIQRIQRSVVSELEKVAVVHLYTLGYKGQDLINFKLKLYNPSKIAQLQELETWRSKLELATTAEASMFSRRWIAKNLLNISDEEFIRNQREKFYDKKIESSMAKLAELAGMEAGALGAAGLGAEGAMPLGMEGEVPIGELPGPEEAPAAPAEVPEEEGAFTGLLASPGGPAGPGTPGKRDEESRHHWVKVAKKDYLGSIKTTTPQSKGKWYSPKDIDQRRHGSPRKKKMMGGGGHAQRGLRGTFPAIYELEEFIQQSDGTISENISNYSNSMEQSMFQANKEMHMLIEGLENRKNENETQ